MAKDKKQPAVDNIISDETGAFDLRFILWRHFCQQNGIPVETLPLLVEELLLAVPRDPAAADGR